MEIKVGLVEGDFTTQPGWQLPGWMVHLAAFREEDEAFCGFSLIPSSATLELLFRGAVVPRVAWLLAETFCYGLSLTSLTNGGTLRVLDLCYL